MKMSYRRIGNYMMGAFIGGLGLFNSSKLEIRQATDTNAELLFQNGQIISATLMFVCFAGILGEFLIMKNPPQKRKGNMGKIRRYLKKEKKLKESKEIPKFDPIPQDDPKFRSKKDKKTIFSSPKIKYKKRYQNKEKVTISPVDETDLGE